jgi:hypothetical protein
VSNVAAAFRLFFWLLYYLINNVAPEPFRRVLNIILVCIFVLVLIVFLLEYVGPLLSNGFSYGPRRLR